MFTEQEIRNSSKVCIECGNKCDTFEYCDAAYEKMIKDFEEQEVNKYDYPEQF